ncbi:MAG: hypothetical protein JSS81_08760 [Acidobacteria bacterium]|nr:hypothetical protein [Acidobacteriota bacterium]
MSLPLISNLEMPILQELSAVGGKEDVRFLYDRLISYFPTLSDADLVAIKSGIHKNWKKHVQKAGRALEEQKLLVRNQGLWQLTTKGTQAVEAELTGFEENPSTESNELLTHRKIQQMLVEIGTVLGYHCEIEFQFFDVVWKIKKNHQRLSHVFEVQSKGNLDSALAKLKRAYENQRSAIFLIYAAERDYSRAQKAVVQEFQEIETNLTILSFQQIQLIHSNLQPIAQLLSKMLAA